MKYFFYLFGIFCYLPCGLLHADGPEGAPPPSVDASSQNENAETMWTYSPESLKKIDPDSLVHRNAARRAEERRRRIAAMRWYGMSNQRPQVSIGPFQGFYAPHWSNRYSNGNWGHGGYNSFGYWP